MILQPKNLAPLNKRKERSIAKGRLLCDLLSAWNLFRRNNFNCSLSMSLGMSTKYPIRLYNSNQEHYRVPSRWLKLKAIDHCSVTVDCPYFVFFGLNEVVTYETWTTLDMPVSIRIQFGNQSQINEVVLANFVRFSQ